MSGRFAGIFLSSCVLGLLSLGYLKSVHSEPTYGDVSSKASEVGGKIVSAIAPHSDEPVIDPDPPAHIKAQDLKLVNEFAAGMGLKRLPKVIYSCKWGNNTNFSASFESTTWTLSICREKLEGKSPDMPLLRVYSIAHEVGHGVDIELSGKTTEPSADGRAVDYLASIGFWGAIKAKVDYSTKGAYKPGMLYAKQVLSRNGKL